MFARLLPLSTLLVLSSAYAADPTETRLAPFAPDDLEGRAVDSSARLLPEGAEGWLPETDGQGFGVALEPGLFPVYSERDLSAALDEILPATGFTGRVSELSLSREPLTLPGMDPRLVEEEAAEGRAALEETLTRRFGALGEATETALDLQERYESEQLMTGETRYRLDQTVDGLVIEGRSVTAVVDDNGDLVHVSGALTNLTELSNRARIDAERASALASAWISERVGLDSLDTPEAMALPTGEGLVAIWRIDAHTSEGDWRLRIDAETGDVLGLEARSYAVEGQGKNALPAPTGAISVVSFEVDPAVSGKFKLKLTDTLTVTPLGADGCGTKPVTVASGAIADFNVSPINGTVISNATSAGYNCRFQEVNGFGRITDAIDAIDALGGAPMPEVTVAVNDSNACGFGINNACSGGSALAFSIGNGTATGSMVFKDLWNTALDETVMDHEFGHTVLWNQSTQGSQGNLDSSLHEGVADYWGMVLVGTDTVGAWTGQNRGGPQEDGRMPRQSLPTDVFPEHILLFGGNNESHANGKMIATALWNTRGEMGDRSPIGAGLADRMALLSMSSVGLGVSLSGSPKTVYQAFQDMLGQDLLTAGNNVGRIDMLQGFARAGIFTSPREAVIDISDDYLATSDPAPTFTVWTGEDFVWSGSSPSESSTSYNPYYEIELANDSAFTVNPVKSGTLNNITEDANGNSNGTWSPSKAQWTSLKGGSVLYYKVTSWGEGGVNSRSSLSTKAGALSVPVASAVINDGGSAGCATGGVGSTLSGLLIGLGALLGRRAGRGVR